MVMLTMNTGLHASILLLGCFGQSAVVMAESNRPCIESIDETFGRGAVGELYSAATYVNVAGNPRLKLVADSFNGTWGTWVAPAIDQSVIEFHASFRFSFKNANGGPGDGFSFLWGDLSDASGTRMSGGEWGVEAFVTDGAGLSIGFDSYPALGDNGVDGRWGGVEFAFEPFDFELARYNDYEEAADPLNMATATVSWTRDTGVIVTIALPTFPPQVIFVDQGQDQTESIDPSGWSYGFAARNGSIDQDVLIGDLVITTIVECPDESLPADLDGDCRVDGADLALLLAQWGACKSGACIGDLDQDGQVDGNDLAQLLGAWGQEITCRKSSPGDRFSMRPLGTTPAGQGYLEYLPEGYASKEDDWPLMIVLHGIGSNGTSLDSAAVESVPGTSVDAISARCRSGHSMATRI